MKLHTFLGISLLATCAFSHATVVNFNNDSDAYFINSVQESGYNISNSHDGMGTLTGGDGYWNTTGSAHLMTWTNSGNVSGFNLTKINGSDFGIDSFVYGNGYVAGNDAPTSITVTGTTSSGSISTNIAIPSLGVYTYQFNNQWSDVSSVSFSAYGQDNRTMFDDIKLHDVPEPATTALLGLGLLGFAASRRKSAKSKNA